MTDEEIAELRADKARIDWLEETINRNGAIHLHDGYNAYGIGIGLRPGTLVRDLRSALDAARTTGARAAFEAWLDTPKYGDSGLPRRKGYTDYQISVLRDAWEAATSAEREACAALCEEDDLPYLVDAIRSRGTK